MLQKLVGRYKLWQDQVTFEEHDGALFRSFNESTPVKLTPHGETEFSADVPNSARTVSWTFDLDGSGRARGAMGVEDLYTSGGYFFLNERPDEPPGPDLPAWRDWLGTYALIVRGVRWNQRRGSFAPVEPGPKLEVSVTMRNGWLYLRPDFREHSFDAKLAESEPGLFFTADGESVRFEPERAIFNNVAYEKAHNSTG
jgi:hypothetical protein